MEAKKFTQLKRTGKNIKHQDKWNYIHTKLMKHIVMLCLNMCLSIVYCF